ncbi:hypothetical protein H696_02987 [Fonticula alba]|uniref:TOG domain-containing protein n=1 Tax=Fonticula alba TaxID=691883 RepID=A0A058Z8P6_FONAL|nr:hypothetical protein H696_02987 [Fonticula alba]KCV70630.1 hypothetical protein H696_02987 [Fonticula alba]|eukprot:XP_009495146.1 hypothetical protein H696_02987 [Fonticula alba]
MDAAAGNDEEVLSLPLAVRLEHKSWKARRSGYEELTTLFRTLDPDSREYDRWQPLLKGMSADTNNIALDAGFVAISTFFENADRVGDAPAAVLPGLVNKGLASPRSITRSKAHDTILAIMAAGTPDPVVQELLPFLDNRLPKLVAAVIAVLNDAALQFGTKTLNPRPLLACLEKIFAHSDPGVRSAGTQLAVSLRRWIGVAPLTALLSNLKPAQQNELKALFDAQPADPPVQTRFTRAQLRAQALAAEKPAAATGGADLDAGLEAGDDAPEEPAEVDPFSLLEPKDVSSNIPDNLEESLTGGTWKTRKEALDELIKVVDFPRLAPSPALAHAVRLMKKSLGDTNVMVAMAAARVIELAALGLREAFEPLVSANLGALIDMFKEKRRNVVEALAKAVDASLLSCTIFEHAETFTPGLGHKNPSIRKETSLACLRYLQKVKTIPDQPEARYLREQATKLMDDSDSTIRECAFDILGTQMRLHGERFMAGVLEGTDKIKQEKIRAAFEKATVVAKPARTAAAAAAAGAAAAAAPAARPSASGAATARPGAMASRPGAASAGGAKPGLMRPGVTSTAAGPAAGTAGGRSLPPTAGAAPGGGASPPMSAVTPAASAPVPAPAPAEPFAFLPSNARVREARIRRELRWQFDQARPEFQQSLAGQVEGHLTPELAALVASTDPRRHAQALDLFEQAVGQTAPGGPGGPAGSPDELFALLDPNVDLLYKFLTLRLFDSNTANNMKAASVLDAMLGVLEARRRPLADYDAGILVPVLVMRQGELRDPVRRALRQINHQRIPAVYPAARFFALVWDTVQRPTKKLQIRVDGLEILAGLVTTQGVAACGAGPGADPAASDPRLDAGGPGRFIPQLLNLAAGEPAASALRQTALNLLRQLYLLDAGILRHVPAAHRRMVDERLKKDLKPGAAPSVISGGANAQPPSMVGAEPAIAAPVAERPGSGSFAAPLPVPAAAEPPAPVAPAGSSVPFGQMPLSASSFGADRGSLPRFSLQLSDSVAHAPLSAGGDAGTERTNFADVESLKRLEKLLSVSPIAKVSEVDHITTSAVRQLHMSLSASFTGVTLPGQQPDAAGTPADVGRLAMHLVGVLVLVFGDFILAQSVGSEAVGLVARELLLRLLDPRVRSHFPNGEHLSRAFNLAMTRVLENGDVSRSIHVLLGILGACLSGRGAGILSIGSPVDLDPRQPPVERVADLVMKCIWKMMNSQVFYRWLANPASNVDAFLLDLHNFLLACPPAMLSRRAAEGAVLGDHPLRTINNLISEAVQSKDQSIYNYVGLIPDFTNSPLAPLIQVTLERFRAARANAAAAGPGSPQLPTPGAAAALVAVAAPPAGGPSSAGASPANSFGPGGPSSHGAWGASTDSASAFSGSFPAAGAVTPSRSSIPGGLPSGYHSTGSFAATTPIPAGSRPAMWSPQTPLADAAAVATMAAMAAPAAPPADPRIRFPAGIPPIDILSTIYRKISEYEDTRQRLRELFYFRRQFFPAEERLYQDFLAQQPDAVKGFVERGLDRVLAEEGDAADYHDAVDAGRASALGRPTSSGDSAAPSSTSGHHSPEERAARLSPLLTPAALIPGTSAAPPAAASSLPAGSADVAPGTARPNLASIKERLDRLRRQ